MSSILTGDIHLSGNVTFGGTVNLPAGSVTDARVAAGANISPTKLQQRQRVPWRQGHSDDNAVTHTQVLYVVTGATGTVREFKAGCVTPPTGNATITVSLHKNGVSILSGPITLNNTQTARQLVASAIQTMSVAANDVLEVVVTATPGTGTIGKGLFGVALVDELPQ